MSGRLKGIVLSISMLRFQYSLKFSFSSTLAYNMDFHHQSIWLLIIIIVIIIYYYYVNSSIAAATTTTFMQGIYNMSYM